MRWARQEDMGGWHLFCAGREYCRIMEGSAWRACRLSGRGRAEGRGGGRSAPW